MKTEIDRLSEEEEEIVEDIMESHGFSDLKDTQEQAFSEGIMGDDNHLLVAETGNGKTLCAEALTRKHLQRDNKVAYLVPSRQLVRDKKQSIEEWADDSIEISTGSGKYHHGDVVVATFSSFYQAVLRGVGQARSFDLAVLDDFHELYGDFIGPGLEKSIAAIKQYNIEIFAMSATIGNSEEISEWLDSDLTVSDSERSIPIEEEAVRVTKSSKKDTIVSFIQDLEDKTPILVFNYAKSWTESRARELSKRDVFDGPDIDGRSELEDVVDGSVPPSLESLATMVENGVAYHHSSLPRGVREWIEDLYQERKIKCLFATTTIAYGFDSPVQTVVVGDMKRRGSWVGKWEYQQWIGRAARPGYGYDVGYSYSITNDPDTVSDEFFEPRELEPITTHIESPQQFRILVLELIVMGWKTPTEIEEFIEETLYWNQLSSEGAWGKSFGNQNSRLKRKLRETADWLEDRGFIRENRTKSEFESTDLGDGAVEFIFESNTSPTLTQVYTFYKWARYNDEMSRLQLLGKVCDVFSLGLREDSANSEVESMIRDEGLELNNGTITAGVIDRYWIQNYSTEEMEKRSNINAGYLKSSCYRISQTLKASERIIEATSVSTPKWLDTYSYRVQRGIKLDEVPYVRNVRGLGRSRVRSLRSYLYSSAKLMQDNEEGDSVWESIDSSLERCSEEELMEYVSKNVEGVGDSISAGLVEYHVDNHIPNVFRENKGYDNGKTSLDDFR